MGEFNIENHIKTSLEDHPTRLDKELLWKNIQGKQRSAFWKKFRFFAVSALCVIAFSTIVYSINNHSDLSSDSNLNTIKTNAPTHTMHTLEENGTALKSSNNEAQLNNELNNLNLEKSNQREDEIQRDNQVKVKQEATNNLNSNPIEKSDANSIDSRSFSTKQNTKTDINTRSVKENETENTITNQSSITGNHTSQKLKKTSNTIIESNKEVKDNSALLKLNNFATSKATNENINQSSDLDKRIFPSSDTHTDRSSILNFESLMSVNHYTSLNTQRTISKALPELEDCFNFNKKSVECYDPNKKKNSISVLTYGLVDYQIKQRSSGQEDFNYLTQRDTTTNYQVSNRLGVQLKYLFRNGIYIKGGIEKGVARTNFYKKDRTITTEILPNQIIDIDVDANGDTTYTFGNAPVTTIKTTTWDVNNTLSTFDIPVLLGYQTKRGPIRYALELGASFNLSQDFNGWLVDESNKPIDASSKSNTAYFNTKTKPSILAGVNIMYSIRPKWQVFVSANMKRGLGYINSDLNLIDEKQSAIGIGLGVEYTLNGK